MPKKPKPNDGLRQVDTGHAILSVPEKARASTPEEAAKDAAPKRPEPPRDSGSQT